jgi:hypothetical protein
MDLVGYVVMPIQKNGRTYLFQIPMGSPYADVKEVCADILVNINQMESDAVAADKKAADETITAEIIEEGDGKK